MRDQVNNKKKSGPTPKAAEDYRNHRVSVYLTDDEFKCVSDALMLVSSTHKFSLGRAMSDHFRRAATHQAPAALPAPAVNVEAWQQLSKLAANVNQLAKNANLGRVVGVSNEQLVALQASIEQLRSELIGLT